MKFVVRYNPYEDLCRLSDYQLDLIREKMSSNKTNGLGLDIRACLISLAFSAEALINMAGYGIYRDKFKERESYIKKRNNVFKVLKLSNIDELEGVLDILQEVRNQFAHAKPSRYEKELLPEENEFIVFSQPSDKYLNISFLERASKALSDLWGDMANDELISEYGLTTGAYEKS